MPLSLTIADEILLLIAKRICTLRISSLITSFFIDNGLKTRYIILSKYEKRHSKIQ